jgi:hypothetical protein
MAMCRDSKHRGPNSKHEGPNSYTKSPRVTTPHIFLQTFVDEHGVVLGRPFAACLHRLRPQSSLQKRRIKTMGGLGCVPGV